MPNSLQDRWLRMSTFMNRDLQRVFRVPIQTLVSPWISALLYIVIFGYIVGTKISDIEGYTYLEFVLPGVLMMNIISSAFMHTSSSLYFQRFLRFIEEILVAPFSYLEMVVGYTLGGVIRALIVAAGIYVMGILFGVAGVAHIGAFLFYVVGVSMIFALLGLIIALWADNFEQFNVLNVFVIMPLSFLGGVFNSITMLPEWGKTIVMFNPFFYFVDGIRYSMIGHSESNLYIGVALIVGLVIVLGAIVEYLFRIGWRLRN